MLESNQPHVLLVHLTAVSATKHNRPFACTKRCRTCHLLLIPKRCTIFQTVHHIHHKTHYVKCPTRFSLPDASFKLSVGLYLISVRTPNPVFLLIKTMFFRLILTDLLLFILRVNSHFKAIGAFFIYPLR